MSTLLRHAEPLAVVRLGPGAELPRWASSGTLLSVTATAAETSVVCAHAAVPAKARPAGPFTAFEAQGPLDLSLTGVLAALLEPLADARVSVFTISTHESDWVLVRTDAADRAVEAWRRSGHVVQPALGNSAEGQES